MNEVREVSIAPVQEASAPVDAIVEPQPTPELDNMADNMADKLADNKADNMAERFAALSRREKEVRESQEAAKADSTKWKEYQDLQEMAKTNPMAVLEKYGMDLDSIITQSLGGEEEPLTAEQQIAALREEIANEKKSITEKAEAAKVAEEKALQDGIDAAVHKHKEGIASHLSDNKEKYELIDLHGGQDLVWEVTEAHFEANDGEILTPEQASDQVEAYYEEQVRKAMQLARFKSTQSTPEATSDPFKTEAPRQASSTLTSDQSAPAGSKNTNMTLEESKAAAASLLQWS